MRRARESWSAYQARKDRELERGLSIGRLLFIFAVVLTGALLALRFFQAAAPRVQEIVRW